MSIYGLELEDVIYQVCPKETPFLLMHNRRRLGPPARGLRAQRRRIARARFKAAQRNSIKKAPYHAWIS